MKYRAKVSFSGRISMSTGDIAEITDEAVSADLLRAGYIEAVEEPKVESKRTRSKRDM